VLDAYLAGGGPRLRHVAGARAYYTAASDVITLPPPAQFTTPAGYYATAFHECGHSTGHPSRLARPGITTFSHFGSGRYAREELVAEMTSAMLAAETGLGTDSLLGNSAAYIASWLRAVRDDPRLVVVAAARAQRACDLILASSGQAPPVTGPQAAAASHSRAGRAVPAGPRRPGEDEVPAPDQGGVTL